MDPGAVIRPRRLSADGRVVSRSAGPRMPRRACCAFVAIVALFVHAGVAAQPAAAQHPMNGASSVAGQALAASVHRTLSCGSCHGEHSPPGAARQACLACHTSAAADFNDGSHGTALRRTTPNAPTCVSCHGSHAVNPARSAGEPTSAREQPASCGSCHKTPSAEFAGGVHGQALLQPTSTLAPTCTTCHGRHLASTSSTPRSPVNRMTVASTCGACHVTALLQFRRSVHGSGVVRNVAHAPTCVTCHGAHAIFEARAGYAPTSALRVSGETCARCHASVLVTEMHDLPVKVVEDAVRVAFSCQQ